MINKKLSNKLAQFSVCFGYQNLEILFVHMFAKPVTQNPQLTTEPLMSQATNPSKSIKELCPFASPKCPQSIPAATFLAGTVSSITNYIENRFDWVCDS
jgi:hypothetical protein